MEMQFNISMDSHYGWIRSEIVASFFCKRGWSEKRFILQPAKSNIS